MMAKRRESRARASRREAMRVRAAERKAQRQSRREGIREGLRMWHDQLRRALEAHAAAARAAHRDRFAFRMRGGARIVFRFGSEQPTDDGSTFCPAQAVAWVRPDGEVVPVDPTPDCDTGDLRARDGWEDAQ